MFDRKINILVLAGVFVLAAISTYYALQIRFDYNFEAFFPHDNEHIDYYNHFKNQFEPDDNFLLVALKNNGASVFEKEFLEQVKVFTQSASELPNVEQAVSLPTLQKPLFVAGNIIPVPVLNVENAAGYRTDSARIYANELYRGRFIADNAQSLVVVLKTPHVLNLEESFELEDGLAALVEQFDFPEVHIAGRSHYQALFVEKTRKEFFLYTGTSAVLIFIVLIILFRKFWGVMIALASVLLGMLFFLGFLGARGIPLDPMSNLFPILMIIVGMSDVIHIMSKYVDELNKGLPRKRAIRISIREIGLATLLTSATTAIGFASLFTSNIPPIKNFGITAAIGVFVAYAAVIVFTPAMLSLFDAKQIIRKKKKKNLWDKLMQWFYVTTYYDRKWVGSIGIGVLLVAILGTTFISTDTHLGSNFPREDRVKKDFEYFEQELGGVRTIELAAIAKPGYTMENRQVLEEIADLEEYLQQQMAITGTLSPATVYKAMNQGYYGDKPQRFELPEEERVFNRLQNVIRQAPQAEMNVVVSEDKKLGRVSAKIRDVGSDSSKMIRRNIRAWVDRNTDTSVVQFKHTGSAFLFDMNNDYLRSSLFSGLGLAFLVVSVLMAFLFRNWKMVIISLIPNVFPLIVAGAIIGFSGIELDAATSIIFAIAFGIAVDDTIHFLSKFKLELNKGLKTSEAIRRTLLETGKALCLTTIILFFGFFILITSTYPPTFFVGLLISLTLLTALIADLFLIPVFIYWLFGKNTDIPKGLRRKKE